MRRHILDTPVTYYAIFLSVRYLPTRLCHWLGKVFALVIYSFSHKDREGLAFNISLALNRAANDPAVREKVRQVFINYGLYMVDFFLMPQLSIDKAKRYFAYVQGEEILQNALARGRGAILLSPHLGNWEFGGVMLRHSKYQLAVVALAHNVPSTNALVNRMRREKGIKVIEVDKSPFSGVEILRHLRNNGVVAMIGDKNFFGRGSPTTFFGKQVIFPLGPVMMAMKSGAALIPAFVLKQSDGRYFGVLEKALPLLLEGEQEKITKKNVDMTAQVFEEYIRRYPDQWYCPDPIAGRVTS